MTELHRHNNQSVTPLHVVSSSSGGNPHHHNNSIISTSPANASSHHQGQPGGREIGQQQQSSHHNVHHHSRHGSNGGGPGLKPQPQRQQQQQQPGVGGGGGVINNNNNFAVVELVRDDLTCPGFGFNIKGGTEHRCPVYIWRVEPGSLADQSGLKSGDEIIQANGISFNGISHSEALKVLKGQTTLTLYIKTPPGAQSQSQQQSQGPLQPPPLHRPPSSQQQQQPIIPLPPPLPPPPPTSSLHHQQGPHAQQSPHSLHHRVEYYTWVDRHGNPVPPPVIQDPYPSSRLINLEICPGQNLGLMIRGGSEYGLGIYVTGVDPGSVAERVGLQRGDEILSVNSIDFTRITHDKAVQILKSCKHMQVIATHIGKIPADLNDGEDLLKLESGNLLDEDICDVVEEVEEIVVDPSDHHHHHHQHHRHNMGVEDSNEILDDVDDEIVDSLMSSANDHRNTGRNNKDKFNLDSLDLDFVRGSSGLGGDRSGSGGKRCTTSILQMIEEKARTVLNKSEHSRFTFYRIEYMQGFLPVVAFVRILLELLNTSEKYTLLTEVRELIRPTDLTQFDELIYSKSTSFRVSAPNPPPVPPPNIINSAVTSVGANMQMNPPQQQQNPFVVDGQGMVSNQQQPVPGLVGPSQIPLPPPLPPPPSQMPPLHHPPQAFLPQQQQLQPGPEQPMGDEVMDDFIEEHGVVLDPSGGFGSWRSGGNLQQQQINAGVQSGFGGAGTDRQLLITHDPAALTMSHPQILNVMNQSITTSPQTTTVTSSAMVNRSPNNNLLGGTLQGIATSPNKLISTSGVTGTVNSNTGQLIPANNVNNQPGSPAIIGNAGGSSVPAVRFKVRITKVKPILGIAIEGGSNTPHRLPRIIDVNPDGSAFHSNLRAGQVLLTVDGKKLDGLTHEEIARLILDCYVDMTKSQIEFLVVEAKQNYYYYNSQQSMEGI